MSFVCLGRVVCFNGTACMVSGVVFFDGTMVSGAVFFNGTASMVSGVVFFKGTASMVSGTDTDTDTDTRNGLSFCESLLFESFVAL